MSYRSIALEVGCTRRTVKRWADKIFGNIKENERSGPEPKVTSRTKRLIVREILQTQTSLRNWVRNTI